MKKEKCGQGRPNCEECPLASYWLGEGLFSPVPALLKKADLLVIGDAPSKKDVVSNRLLTGQEGAELLEVLPSTLSYTNDCMSLAKGQAQGVSRQLRLLNRKRRRKGPSYPFSAGVLSPASRGRSKPVH